MLEHRRHCTVDYHRAFITYIRTCKPQRRLSTDTLRCMHFQASSTSVPRFLSSSRHSSIWSNLTTASSHPYRPTPAPCSVCLGSLETTGLKFLPRKARKRQQAGKSQKSPSPLDGQPAHNLDVFSPAGRVSILRCRPRPPSPPLVLSPSRLDGAPHFAREPSPLEVPLVAELYLNRPHPFVHGRYLVPAQSSPRPVLKLLLTSLLQSFFIPSTLLQPFIHILLLLPFFFPPSYPSIPSPVSFLPDRVPTAPSRSSSFSFESQRKRELLREEKGGDNKFLAAASLGETGDNSFPSPRTAHSIKDRVRPSESSREKYFNFEPPTCAILPTEKKGNEILRLDDRN
jgi:hypothetical protein